jgi:hypothetical protein
MPGEPPETPIGRNLARKTRIAVHLESGDQEVNLNGEAREEPHPPRELTEQVARCVCKPGIDLAPKSWM